MPPVLSRRPALAAAALVALAALAVYALTLTPDVGLVDSGELTLAAWEPGVPHPPGTPFYVLIGYLFAQLPLGSVALRLNWMSAVFAALAAGLIVLAAWEMRPAAPAASVPQAAGRAGARAGATRPRGPGDAAALPGWWALLPALAAGLAFAFARALWFYAVVAEVYTLHAALLAGVLAALLAWRRNRVPGSASRRDDRWLYLAALLYGLALSVHSATALVFAPAGAVLVLSREWPVLSPWLARLGRRRARPARRGSRRAAAGAAAGTPAEPPASAPSAVAAVGWAGVRAGISLLAGLLVYAYLPLRAAGSPLLNWGDPDTLQTFWWHVTGKWYQFFLETAEQTPVERMGTFLALLAQQHVYLGLPAIAAGLWALWRRDRALLVFMLLALAGNLLLFSAYDVYQDRQAYLYPALPALALLIGEGVRWLLARLLAAWTGAAVREELRLAAALVLALVIPVVALAGNYRDSDHSRDWLAADAAHNLLAGLQPNALLLTSEWDVLVGPLLYVQHVAGARPDVTVVDVTLVRRSWYADYVRRVDPALAGAVAPEYAAFLASLTTWERGGCEGRVPNPECALLQERFEALFERMVAWAQAAGRPVYLTNTIVVADSDSGPVVVTEEVDAAVNPQARGGRIRILAPAQARVPEGLAYRLYPEEPARPAPLPPLQLRGLSDGTVPLVPGTVAADKVPPLYLEMLLERGRYLDAHGADAEADEAYRLALVVAPDNAEARQGAGP
jgi:hypothetical protein